MPAVAIKFRDLLLEKQAKDGRRISLVEVAERTSLSRSAITAWDKGDVTRLDVSTITALCDYFGVSLCQLLEYEPAEKNQNGSKRAA